jgi:hypothetical protein
MTEQRIPLDEEYEIIVSINTDILPQRPIYGAEIAMVLIDRSTRKEVFHISNYHWKDRLGGHPTLAKKDRTRKAFVNLSEGTDPKRMSFASLKANFVDECCARVGEQYRPKLEQAMRSTGLEGGMKNDT